MSPIIVLGLIMFIVACPIAMICKAMTNANAKPAALPVARDPGDTYSAGYEAAAAEHAGATDQREANAWLAGFHEAHHNLVVYELLMADQGWDYAPAVRENMIRLGRREIDDVKAKVVDWANRAGRSPEKLLLDAEKLLGYGGALDGIGERVGVSVHDLEIAR